ncbi:MAG: EamA family transporter [archaeon]
MWALLAISSAFLWASSNTIDKYVVSKLVRNPFFPVTVAGILGLVSALIIFFFQGFAYLSIFHIILAFVAGAFIISSFTFYFKALQIEELSTVIPLYYLGPVFITILAAIFLGEIFTPIKYLGITFLIIGAILISSARKLKLNFGKGFWLMILAATTWAIEAIIIKYLLNFADFWTIFSYIKIGMFLTIIPIIFLILPDIKQLIKQKTWKAFGFMGIAESIGITGDFISVTAMSIGFVSLVTSLTATQPFFVLAFAIILSLFFPKILKEEIGRKTILLKIIAIILIVAGAITIT